MNRREFVAGGMSSIALSRCVNALQGKLTQTECASLIGGARRIPDRDSIAGYLVSLTEPGQGVSFSGLPAGNKLVVHYASMSVGTISVAVNNGPTRKVNIHSSGALTGTYITSVVDLAIPANATVAISLAPDDVGVNINRLLVEDASGLLPDIWNLPPLPVASGPFSPDWKSIGRGYTVPAWWREAKFGAWSHWDPQSMPEQGDWYARGMYMQGGRQYEYHLKHFGHPSEYGYKDICRNWVIDRWNPEQLMSLYVEMGARYFMAMGCHHDNFDCFDSKYQPWNSAQVGPKVDIVGTWEKVARRHGMHFGIGFHDTPARTWGQFMPVRYTGDKTGPMKDVPYDALQTIRDGKDQWWEGMDPADLYGTPHTITMGIPRGPGNDPLHSPFANQFMWRVDDAITKYHPDIIYFDEHAGDSQVDLGVHMGLGFLAPQLIANFYNKSLQWNQGTMAAVVNLKGVGGRYNSFQDDPELLPYVDRSLVKSTEAIIEPEIMAYPFQTETTIADWHYRTGQKYMDAARIVHSLMDNVCRNGTMLLNLTQHGRGDLDPEVIAIARDIGAWLKINGEAVYGSRPFEVFGEGGIRYTRNHGNVYATLLNWHGGPVTLKALRAGGATLGKVSKVELLGSNVPLTFLQGDQGLTVSPIGPVQPLPGIANDSLASGLRVLRVTHDKGWINDDDLEVVAYGWVRRCNLGSGDYNNDLTTSDTPGDVWKSSFTGSGVSVIAPKEAGAGKIEIQIDGFPRATSDLSTTGARQAQQSVCQVAGLTLGKHSIAIINRGPGPVAIDALVVQ